MTLSYTTTRSEVFTAAHAWHVAVKVGTDLKRMQRFYGRPSDAAILDYEKEAVVLLCGNYMEAVEYGFQREGRWVVALRYVARRDGVLVDDDVPGRVPLGVNISECNFASFLRRTQKWHTLSDAQQERIYADAGISFRRTPGNGYAGNWGAVDKTYSAGGGGVTRQAIG